MDCVGVCPCVINDHLPCKYRPQLQEQYMKNSNIYNQLLLRKEFYYVYLFKHAQFHVAFYNIMNNTALVDKQ
jgi:hypothetical protein